MKLKDLIVEAKVFKNNFIKIDMVKNELSIMYDADSMPKVDIDIDGMFIILDNFKLAMFKENDIFSIDPLQAVPVNREGSLKKYYIDFKKEEATDTTGTEGEGETPAEPTA